MSGLPRVGSATGIRRLAVGLVIVFAVLGTFVLQDYQLGLLCSAFYRTVAVLSLNVLVGLNGQISIGHAAFMGVGAYTVAILVTHGWPFWAAIIAAVAVTAFVGTVASVPALRLRGLYVALTTLSIALVFPTIVLSLQTVTNGNGGLQILESFDPPGSLDVTAQQWTYLVLLVLTLASLLLASNIKHSRVGRAMMAIRDQDIVAESFGVPLARIKVLTFALSSALAGLAGAMFAIQNRFVSSDDFTQGTSINLLVGMAISGGTSILGAAVGGLFLQYVPSYTPDLNLPSVLSPLVYGIILILFTILFRKGLLGGLADQGRRLVRLVTERGARRRPRLGEPLGLPDDEPRLDVERLRG